MQTPLVSIIIPTYNRVHLISQTLDSVLAQTYANWECIVVDDGSNDSTDNVLATYCKRDSRFQYHNRPKNRLKGANACRNYGFEISKGEYIQFLDSDDILEIFCLKERVSLVLNNKSINLLIRDTSLLINKQKQKVSINKDPQLKTIEAYLRMFLGYNIPWPIMGAFYKRNILEICKFDENLDRFQDVSFNINVLSQYYLLNILRDFKIDSYYRNSKEDKVINENYYRVVVSSFFKIMDKYENLINTNQDYKSAFKRFCYIISRDFIFFNVNSDKKVMRELFLKFKTIELIGYKEKIIFRTFWIYYILGLINKKGFGINRIRKYANNYFNNLIIS